MAENRNAQQVKEITDKLEQGIKELFESERFKEYLRTMSKFYNYSWSNTLLIAMQKPDATLIAGYTSWQRNFDRQVMKGEKGIKILAPAPYKAQVEMEKIDPKTQRPMLDADGKPVTETIEVMRPAFKVVSVFDVSQTDGKELPDIMVGELTGSVEQYEDFWRILKEISPVPVGLENIEGGAHGYYHLTEKRIAIDNGMSEMQTIKTLIHEIAHAKLHAIDPDEKVSPEVKKDRHTKEVEAEAVAYTVCQRYGLETSDYSFGYIAGWSSDKETKELKGSLETIRSTAADMIESIDEKLKLLAQEKAKATEVAVEAEAEKTEAPATPSMVDIPVYREYANYAYEAGEMDAYRASRDANMACCDAIEASIEANYGNNRLNTEAAVKSVLEQFPLERVEYVLASTIQQKDHDGRISPTLKEWAKDISVCPDHAKHCLMDQAHPGLLSMFATAFTRQVDAAERRTDEVRDPVVSQTEKSSAPKPHRLTPDEKKIKDAVMDVLKGQIAHSNDGMLSTYRTSEQSHRTLCQHNVKIEGNTVTQNGEPMYAIHRRHSEKKTKGCYRELTPTLEYIKKEQKQEKSSIREQLKAAAKSQPEKKAPAKAKKHDMGLE